MSTEISLSLITEGKLNGEGAFDKFVHALREQLKDSARNDDLSTAQTAEILSASMPSLLQQAVAFGLGKDRAQAEVDLTKKQMEKVDAEIDGIEKNNELLDKQIIRADYETEQVQKQNLLLDEQILTAQVQREKTEKEIEILDLQYQITEQQVKESIAKVALAEAQVIQMNAQAKLTEQQVLNAAEELNLLRVQKLRTDQEVLLMTQKVKTEKAQIQDEVDGVTVAGAIGSKTLTMKRQADGFLRDAEQKAAKIMSDIWSLDKSANPATSFISMIAGDVASWDGESTDGAPIPVLDANGIPQNVSKIKAAVDALVNGVASNT